MRALVGVTAGALIATATAVVLDTVPAQAEVGTGTVSVVVGPEPLTLNPAQNATITVTSTSSTPSKIESIVLHHYCPGGGASTAPCASPEAVPFARAGTNLGQPGTVCADVHFAESNSPPGSIRMVPDVPVTFTGPNQVCTVRVFYELHHLPVTDVIPATPAADSYTQVVATLTDGAPSPATTTFTGIDPITIGPATSGVEVFAGDSIQVGGSATATARVGSAEGSTGTVTFRLYGPDDATCAGPTLPASPVPVPLANGFATSPAFTPAAAGLYRWVAAYSGDRNNLPSESPCNTEFNRLVVSAVGSGVPTLTLSTPATVRADQGTLATAVLQGGNDPTGTITFTQFDARYEVAGDPPCSHGVRRVVTRPVSAAGTFATDAFPDFPGTHRWQARYSGDANDLSVTSACVTTTITKAQSAVAITPSTNVPLGGQLTVTAAVTGFAPDGDVTFTLYGPDSSCAGPPLAVETRSVDDDFIDSVTSSPVTPTVAGTYRWQVSYAGDDENLPATSACSASTTVGTVITPTNLVVTPPFSAGQPSSQRGRPTARLTTSAGAPASGQLIQFTAGPWGICAARTDVNGVATCRSSLFAWFLLLSSGRLRATYAGSAAFGPSIGSAGLFR